MKNSLLFFPRLETLRGQRSKAAFCRSIGVSTPLYQKWAGGSIPGGDKLKLISKACGVSVEWLLSGDGVENQCAVPSSVSPAPPAVYPVASDLAAEVAHVREDMASMRAQLDTVTRLLGAALGSALPAPRDHNQPHPHKAHPRRAAG